MVVPRRQVNNRYLHPVLKVQRTPTSPILEKQSPQGRNGERYARADMAALFEILRLFTEKLNFQTQVFPLGFCWSPASNGHAK